MRDADSENDKINRKRDDLEETTAQKWRSHETELQIEARIEETMKAGKDFDGSTDGSIISSYFLEIRATPFLFKEEKMTTPANKEDWQEMNQIVVQAEGIRDRSQQAFIQTTDGPKRSHGSTLCKKY